MNYVPKMYSINGIDLSLTNFEYKKIINSYDISESGESKARKAFSDVINFYLRFYSSTKKGKVIIKSKIEKFTSCFDKKNEYFDETCSVEINIIRIWEIYFGKYLKYDLSQVGEVECLEIKKFKTTNERHEREIEGITKKLNEIGRHIHTFFAHGSLADGGYAEYFSDLDVFLVLKDSIFENEMTLSKVRAVIQSTHANFFRLDPAAHHEYGKIHIDSELLHYRYCYLPLREVGPFSGHLIGETKISYRSVDSGWDRIETFFRWLTFYRTQSVNQIRCDMFHLKCRVSDFSLFPCLFYQLAGEFHYKPEAIEKFNKQFGEARFISYATEERKNWKLCRANLLIPESLPPKIYRKLNSYLLKVDDLRITKKRVENFNLAVGDLLHTFNEILNNEEGDAWAIS